MKKLFILSVSLLLILVGCSEDPYFEKTPLPEKEYHPASLQLWLTSAPDFVFPAYLDVPDSTGGIVLSSGGWMSGHATNIYHVDSVKSYFVYTRFTEDPDHYQLTSTFEGTLTTETGESFTYKGHIRINILRSTFDGTIEISGGTGKYEYSYGSLAVYGRFLPSGVSIWNGYGTIFLYK